jgi:S1-C subfamily serine protease
MRQTELFDDYLNGELSEQQQREFENELAKDASLAKAFNSHKRFVETLKTAQNRSSFKTKLKTIHEKEFGGDAKIISVAETFASKHGKTIAVAASTALIAVLSTVAILSTGGYVLTKQNGEITNLNRKVKELEASQAGIVEGITRPKKTTTYAPANIEGSAFAISNAGYVLTSYHMVKDADSIFIRNNFTERVHANLVLSDARLDIAILKVENKDAVKTWQVPFSIKNKGSEVGEKVFTLGYPRKDFVYGEGSLSSLSGYSNDTSMYQISIPVNPGNSGGPLLDESGNVIGLVRSKASGAEATGFAVKSIEILNAINSLPDSTRAGFGLPKAGKNQLRNLKRTEQIKKINPYVFNVLVYKKD